MDEERKAHLERILANRRQRGAASTQPVPLREGLEDPPPRSDRPAERYSAASTPVGTAAYRPASAASDSPVPAVQNIRPAASAPSPAPTAEGNPRNDFMSRVANVIRPSDPLSLHLREQQADRADGRPPVGGAGGRSGSVASAAGSVAGADPNALFAKGRFEDFRKHPTLVTDVSTIIPYRSERRQGHPRSRTQSPTARSVATTEPRNDGSLGNLPVTEPNPFRTQPFESFVIAPDYSAPAAIADVLERASRQTTVTRNHRNEALAIPGLSQNRERTPARNAEPFFHADEALATLREGDWFLKWTRRKDKVHRRFFWLGNDDTLYWARAPGLVVLLATSIRLSEIVQIDTTSEVDAESGRTFYIMIIWSVSRAAQIGTEISAKFDLWYETLKHLSARHRNHNLAYFSRHATMQAIKHNPNVGAPANGAD